jgi:putative DNA primase/helicase
MKHEKSLARSAEKSKHERPTIVLKPGKPHRAVDQAESALRGRSEEFKIFQRGGELVRAFCLPARHDDRHLRRPRGSVQLESLSSTALTEVFNRIAKWRRKNSRGIVVRLDCPPKIAAIYLSRTGSWRVPVLTGIISAPILREDGSVLDKSGYDAATGLYLVSDEDSPAIPERPTRADGEAAVQTILAPFAEFPFVTDADRAVHVACILTAIQRPLLRACPIFGYSAPMQRSGKSLLAESVAIITTGKPAPASAISGDREEIRKMITSVLREGHSIINLDNVEHPLASADLAKAITQPEYQDRALGTNRMFRLPTSVLWTATGNNLAFRKDLSSRALLCRIDPTMERPEERTFKIEGLKEFLTENRTRLISAALTILRAYHVAGRPRQQVKPWGGFDNWSASIREPLVWLGLADPCKTRETVLTDDPEREESLAALHAVHVEFGDDEFTTKRIMRHCNTSVTLRTAMEAVAAGRHKEIDSRSLGWWLRRNHDRILGGLRLETPRQVSGVAIWRVVGLPGGQSGHGGQFPAGGAMVKRFPGLGNTPAKDGTVKRFPRLPEKQ